MVVSVAEQIFNMVLTQATQRNKRQSGKNEKGTQLHHGSKGNLPANVKLMVVALFLVTVLKKPPTTDPVCMAT